MIDFLKRNWLALLWASLLGGWAIYSNVQTKRDVAACAEKSCDGLLRPKFLHEHGCLCVGGAAR